MFKRMLDIVGAMVGLVVFSPVFLIAAVAIRITSPGPVFFIQKRLGLNGDVFAMFKFRTMVDKAEQMGTGLFSYEDDDRITKVGKILRLTSLDEIPQFFNVLNGTMSLVGPRPPVTYELGDYADFTDHMKVRFQVKPGITGLAQVSGRNDLNWDQKIVYDNIYVEKLAQWGVLYDIKVLAMTVWVVIRSRNVIEAKDESAK